MTTTTDKGLTDEELMAIVDRATPGEWVKNSAYVEHADGDVCKTYAYWLREDGTYDAPNAEYIATFDPPMVRALFERARAAETRALAMEEALKKTAALAQAAIEFVPDPDGYIAFTDRWAHLGKAKISDVLDEADRALSTEAQS